MKLKNKGEKIMANDINVVVIQGRLTAEPRLSSTQTGKSILNFSIASNSTWMDAQKNKQDNVSFFDCVMFGAGADTMSKYLQKGGQVIINGTLRQNRWQDQKTGQNKNKISIHVDRINMIGSKQNNNQNNQQQNNIPDAMTQQYNDPWK